MTKSLEQSIRILLSQLGVRPSPEFSASELVRRFASDFQVTVTEVNGCAEFTQNGQPASAGSLLKAFSLKETNRDLFIVPDGIPRSREDFKGDTKAMSEFISKNSGHAFERLMSQPHLKPNVQTMNFDEMDGPTYRSLTRAEKMAIVGAVGPDGVARINARKPKVVAAK